MTDYEREEKTDEKIENFIKNVLFVILFFVFAAFVLDGHESRKYVEKDITRTVTVAPGERLVGVADVITYTGVDGKTATFSIYEGNSQKEPRFVAYKPNKTFTIDVMNTDGTGDITPVKLRFIKRDDDTLTFAQTTPEDVDKKTGKVRYPIEGVDTE